MNTAARDYANARCLLLNHLVSGGLMLGAQAIDKFLKAHILLKDPIKAVWGHELSDLLNEADLLSPGLGLSKFAKFTDRFEGHYRNRYPDDPNASTSMNSGEIFELDEFIIFLNENLPCFFEAKYRTGLYTLMTFSLHGGTVTPWERWINQGNGFGGPLATDRNGFPGRSQETAPRNNRVTGRQRRVPILIP